MVSWVGWGGEGGRGWGVNAGWWLLGAKGQQQVGYYRCYVLRNNHGQIRISIALIFVVGAAFIRLLTKPSGHLRLLPHEAFSKHAFQTEVGGDQADREEE